eukprot:121573_1
METQKVVIMSFTEYCALHLSQSKPQVNKAIASLPKGLQPLPLEPTQSFSYDNPLYFDEDEDERKPTDIHTLRRAYSGLRLDDMKPIPFKLSLQSSFSLEDSD